MDPFSLQIIMAAFTILGSGLSVYVGAKVAIAEIKTTQKYQETSLMKLELRIDRLEKRYFKDE